MVHLQGLNEAKRQVSGAAFWLWLACNWSSAGECTRRDRICNPWSKLHRALSWSIKRARSFVLCSNDCPRQASAHRWSLTGLRVVQGQSRTLGKKAFELLSQRGCKKSIWDTGSANSKGAHQAYHSEAVGLFASGDYSCQLSFSAASSRASKSQGDGCLLP